MILEGMKPHRPVSAFVIGILLIAAVTASAAPNPPLPTPADLQAMFNAAQYRTALQQIARVMQLKGDLARPYDIYALLLLRGDCLIHLNDKTTAFIAYAAAAKSPVAAQAAQARAMILLLRRSTGFEFAPPAGGEPIDVLSPDGRKKAMLMMFNEGLNSSEPEIRNALASSSLVPSIDLLPHLRDLYALELTATGNDGQLRPILTQMGEHARALMTHELDLLDQRINAIQNAANQVFDLGIGEAWWQGAGVTRRGLTSMDRDNLRSMMDYITKIQDTAAMGRQQAVNFSGNVQAWYSIIAKAASVRQRADDVLAAE